MGLFDRGLAVRLRGEDITRALRQVGAQHRIDLFWFEDQPVTWDGFSNPLVHLPHQPSPSSAWKTALMLDDEAMIRSLMSSESRKKLRHKEKKLGAFGTISFSEILHPREVDQALTAFFEQKAQRLSVMGFANPFAEVCVQSFIRSAALSGLAEGKPALSLFAMKAGERFLSVFGGLISGGRFTGMFTSFDADPDVARYSPGDLLLLNLVRMMCRKGLHTFDLGTGEAAYKNDYCRTEEPLFDSLLPMTWKGSVAAMGVSTLTSAKRKIKRNERALALLKRLRGFVRGRG